MIIFECTCGRKLRAKDEATGKRVRCPACRRTVVVPKPQKEDDSLSLAEEPQESPAAQGAEAPPAERPGGGTPCPHCYVPLPAGAVLCTTCGFDLRTGRTIQPSKTLVERIPWHTVRVTVVNLILLGILIAVGMWAISYIRSRERRASEDQQEEQDKEGKPKHSPPPHQAHRPAQGLAPLLGVRVRLEPPSLDLPKGLTLQYTDGTFTPEKTYEVLREKIEREAADAFYLRGHRVARNGKRAPADGPEDLLIDVRLALGWDFRPVDGKLLPLAPYVVGCAARLQRKGVGTIWTCERPYMGLPPESVPTKADVAALAQAGAVRTDTSFDRYSDRVVAAVAREVFRGDQVPDAAKVNADITRDRMTEQAGKAALDGFDKDGDASRLVPLVMERNPYVMAGLARRLDKIRDPAILLSIAEHTTDRDLANRAGELYVKATGKAPTGVSAVSVQKPEVLMLGPMRAKFTQPGGSFAADAAFLQAAASKVPHLTLAFAEAAAQLEARPEVKEALRKLCKDIEAHKSPPLALDIDCLTRVADEEAANLLGREAALTLIRSGYHMGDDAAVLYLDKVAAGFVPDMEQPWPDGSLRLSPFQWNLLEEVNRFSSDRATDVALGLLLRVGGEQRERLRAFVKLPEIHYTVHLVKAEKLPKCPPDQVRQILSADRDLNDLPLCEVLVDTYYRYTHEKVALPVRTFLLTYLCSAARDSAPYFLTFVAMLESPNAAESQAGEKALGGATTYGPPHLDTLKAERDRAKDARVKSVLATAVKQIEAKMRADTLRIRP